MDNEKLPSIGFKLTIKGKLYKVTGYLPAYGETLVILDPMEPTLLTKRLKVRSGELQEFITQRLY